MNNYRASARFSVGGFGTLIDNFQALLKIKVVSSSYIHHFNELNTHSHFLMEHNIESSLKNWLLDSPERLTAICNMTS